MCQLSQQQCWSWHNYRIIRSVIKDVWELWQFLFSSVQKAFATVVTAAEKVDANSTPSEEMNEIIQYPFIISSTVVPEHTEVSL